MTDRNIPSKQWCKHDWVGDNECAYCALEDANELIAEVREILSEFDSEDVRVMARRAVERSHVETPAHRDPTGKTREPPHCPTCACGLATETKRCLHPVLLDNPEQPGVDVYVCVRCGAVVRLNEYTTEKRAVNGPAESLDLREARCLIGMIIAQAGGRIALSKATMADFDTTQTLEHWVDPASGDSVYEVRREVNGAARHCEFGGNYGQCELEEGHDGRHKITAGTRPREHE